MPIARETSRRAALGVQSLAWAIALLAAAPAAAQTYTVSGYTFEKPQNVGSNERENRAVQRVEESGPDVSTDTGPSQEDQAEEEREAEAQAREQQKLLAQQEKLRIQTNEQKIAAQLAAAAERPTIELPVITLDSPNEARIATRKQTLELAIEDPSHRVGALRAQAREEWYWFQANNFDLMWGAFWAGLDPTGQQSPLDDTAREAAEHLAKYMEIVREVESITHTSEYAQERYAERVKYLSFARKGNYNVDVSDNAAKTDIYPPADTFHPWSEDEIIRKGTRCTFDMSGVCR